MRGSLDGCVKCTVCETFCPVAAVTPLFPGPKYAGPQSERFRSPDDTVDASLDYCSGCGICTQVCPQDVHIAEINAQARAEMKAEQGMPLRDQVIARPHGARRALAADRAARQPVARAQAVPGRAREDASASTATRPLPRFAFRTFQSWAQQAPAAGRTRRARSSTSTAAPPTATSPRLAKMTVEVLEHNGYRVVVPPAGLLRTAAAVQRQLRARAQVPAQPGVAARAAREEGRDHRRDLDQLRAHAQARGPRGARRGRPRSAAGRRAHLRHLRVPARPARPRASCAPTSRPLPLRVPYHQPCQGRGHGFGKPALDLLGLIPELDVIEVDHVCCGVAGTYGLKIEKYDIAMQVGAPLFADIVARPGRRLGVRLRDVPLADRQGHRHPERPPGRAAAPRLRPARPGA